MTLEPRATCDFETRSQCDLKKHGSWKYSLDPTTSVLCLAFHVPGSDETGLWHPAFPHLNIPETDHYDNLIDLLDWIQLGGLVEAHNAFFERGIWENILVPRYGYPPIAPSQWRCSAAKAAALALPRGLGDVAAALKLPVQKDAAGHLLMKKVSKPRKALKAEGKEWVAAHGAGKCLTCKGKGTYKRKPCATCEGRGQLGGDESLVPALPVLWHESADQLADLWDYCRTDVKAEHGVSLSIPDLNPAETEMYLLDQTINTRGFQLDPAAVETALALIAEESADLSQQLATVTDGEVTKATQRARMMKWFASQGLELTDTQGATIDATLERGDLPNEAVKTGLSILRELGRSSTAKYQTMERWACPDGRVRGGLLFHGASTGRWSGAGVQPHNFVRGSVKDQDALWTLLNTGNRAAIREKYGSVMQALANGLRGAICAGPGTELFVADYASIEARVILWLAGDEPHLDMIRAGADMYLDMGSTIYGYTCTDKDKFPAERALGKIAILGLGYQLGWRSFIDSAAMYKITISEDLSKQTVDAYRNKYWRVVEMWSAQERTALEVTATWQPQRCGLVTWSRDLRFLFCTLPSGRRLSYPFPEVHSKQTAWGEWRQMVTFEAVDPYTRQWKRQSTYGGMLVNNLVQAVARDIMAEAMLRAEKSQKYLPVLSVHDELVAECKTGEGDVKEFEGLLTTLPNWARGCPISADGYRTQRYRK